MKKINLNKIFPWIILSETIALLFSYFFDIFKDAQEVKLALISSIIITLFIWAFADNKNKKS